MSTLTPQQEEAQYVSSHVKKYVRTMARIIKLFFDQHDKETSVADMISNMLHYCDKEEIDFLACYERGRGAYNSEVMDMRVKGGEHV